MRLVVALILSLASPAHALTVYTDRAQWEAAAGSVTTEDFSGVSPQVIPRNTGGTIAASGFDIVIPKLTLETGIYDGLDVDGTRGFYGDLESPPADDYNVLEFHAPVRALGFDVGHVELGSGIALEVGSELVPIYQATFVGIVGDAPFSSARIVLTSSAPRFYAIDNVSFAVDEPAVILLLLGCVLVAVATGSRWNRPQRQLGRRLARHRDLILYTPSFDNLQTFPMPTRKRTSECQRR